MREILDRAAVPEHSAVFMQVMSGGRAFCRDGFLFLTAEDWLMGIGYPLLPENVAAAPEEPDGEAVAKRFEKALAAVVEESGASTCWAVAPDFPERLQGYVENRDRYYVLDVQAQVPAALRGPVAVAAQKLRVAEGRQFTPSHRRLWAEFLSRVTMRPNVRELYARTEAVLASALNRQDGADAAPLLDLRLLDAVDEEGNLAASLLLDYSPKNFCAYIIGAHSRAHYAPHATDLLFSSLLERCRAEGKKYIHLGLGVNEGIARFKRKWGGRAVLPYAMAAWKEQPSRSGSSGAGREVNQAMRALLSAPADMSKRQIFETLPQQRTFAMIFEVRKGDAVSYLCGSAHFFRYSFEFSFRELFDRLHTMIFEGPLDEDFLAAVEKSGRSPEPGSPRVAASMSEGDMRCLERMVYGPEGPLARFFGYQKPRTVDVRDLLANTRPWFGFFSLWVGYLERLGWQQSVDLEAWRTAKDMGKAVIAMENLEEQLDSLESVPIPRIVEFLRHCSSWPAYVKRNVKTYLAGDLRGMMGSSVEFPTRMEMVIERRDERFRQRMRPFLEAGGCAVFVGTAHLVGLIPMLEQDGFSVTPHYLGAGLKFRAFLRRLFSR